MRIKISLIAAFLLSFSTTAAAHDAANCSTELLRFDSGLALFQIDLRAQREFAQQRADEWIAAAQSGDQDEQVSVALNHMNKELPVLLELMTRHTDVTLDALTQAVAVVKCLGGTGG